MNRYVRTANLGDVFDDMRSISPKAEELLNSIEDQAQEVQQEGTEAFKRAVARNPVEMMLFAAAGGAIGGQVLKSMVGVAVVGALGLWIGARVLDPKPPARFDPTKPPKNPKQPQLPPAQQQQADDLASRLREALKGEQLLR